MNNIAHKKGYSFKSKCQMDSEVSHVSNHTQLQKNPNIDFYIAGVTMGTSHFLSLSHRQYNCGIIFNKIYIYEQIYEQLLRSLGEKTLQGKGLMSGYMKYGVSAFVSPQLSQYERLVFPTFSIFRPICCIFKYNRICG